MIRHNNILKIFAITIAIGILASCSGMIQQNSHEKLSSDGKTYISVSARTAKASRTINPATGSADVNDLTDLTLKGRKVQSSSSSQAEMQTIATADSLSELTAGNIEIASGNWEFELTALYNDLIFGGSKTMVVTAGEVNTISFVIDAVQNYGGLSVTVNWDSANGCDKCVAILKNSSQTEQIEKKDFLNLNNKTSFTYTRDISDSELRLPAETYYLRFEFYKSVGEDNFVLLNTSDHYVRIRKGYVSTATVSLVLNQTYTITYEADDGELADGEIQNLNYSIRSGEITLPLMRKTGFIFDGWYTNSSFTGSSVTSIAAGSSGNKTFYAKWKNSILYVSGVGDDANDGFSADSPLESIDKACELIIANGAPGIDWTINIIGDVTGPHEGTNKAGKRTYSKDYGRAVIPSELTLEHAGSILLTGYNGLDADGIPQDMLNRGFSSIAGNSGSEKGLVLGIATEVPVTIKNLKITGGNNATSNGSSDVYCNKGGGLCVGANAVVTLSDGVLIVKNGSNCGGGIYNSGTLYINGTASIGNKTQTETVYKSAANTGEDGGGIYNEGNLYLGYSEYISESSNTPKEWTGFIQYNYSWRGGAIKNAGTGNLVMNSGTIAYNESANNSNAYGAGIYNLGTFLMTGGTIELNRTEGSNGGGVYNASNSSETGTFIFTGGVIRKNHAVSGYGVSGDGGGVYNNGVMYIYGDALIGDETKKTMASGIEIAEDCSNLADGNGGGIYVGSSGKLYMGYSSYTSETVNTPAKWNKGIYYNYAGSGGGGLGCTASSTSTIVMNSGVISNNAAAKNGNAVFFYSDNFVFCGTASIPAGDGEVKQDVYYFTTKPIKIGSSLSHLKDNPIYIIPSSDDNKTQYYTNQPVIALTEGAAGSGLTLADVLDFFVVEPLTETATGFASQWHIDSATGKVARNAANLYVASVSKGGSDDNSGLSASAPLATIAAAVSKMNNATMDYTITLDTLNSEITGPQFIVDPAGGTIQANSIKILGKNAPGHTYVPRDTLNGGFGDNETGTTLTVKTVVPVTLNGILVTGGHGTLMGSGSDAKVIGGGLLIGEGSKVTIENNTRILGNITYANSSVEGYGAGVYVSENAEFYINNESHVTENIGTKSGAGVYIAAGGYTKLLSGWITLNTFDESFTRNGQPVDVNGGGVYIADNATLIMTGGEINVNTANAADGASGFGSGVFVSGKTGSEGHLKISAGKITKVNDVYLQNNVMVEINAGLSATPTARLTPEHYPADDTEEIKLLYLNPKTGSSLFISTQATHFEISPQPLAGGEKQYWYLDGSTQGDGKLAKKVGMGFSVAIPLAQLDDMNVSVTADGNVLKNVSKIESASNIVFTATDGYESYIWYVDGAVQTENTNEFAVKASDWGPGAYDVYLEAKDSNGKFYSYTAQIIIRGN